MPGVEVDVGQVTAAQPGQRRDVKVRLEEGVALVVADGVEGVGRLQLQRSAVATPVRRAVVQSFPMPTIQNRFIRK